MIKYLQQCDCLDQAHDRRIEKQTRNQIYSWPGFLFAGFFAFKGIFNAMV